nr:lon protease homolog 1, mitochondrial-like [Tanacetum cinerariifolium]
MQLLKAQRSSEFNVTHNYLDWLTALPWGNYSFENMISGTGKRPRDIQMISNEKIIETNKIDKASDQFLTALKAQKEELESTLSMEQ